MILALYTSRGVLYAARMIVGVSGGVQAAAPDPDAARSVDDVDEVHAASTKTAIPRNAGRTRRNNHRGMSPSFSDRAGHDAPSHWSGVRPPVVRSTGTHLSGGAAMNDAP
jgi:hypothetical protein